MSSIDSSFCDDSSYELDRTLIDLSGRISSSFYRLNSFFNRFISPIEPEKFNNASTLTQEIATRVFIFLGTLVGIVCGAPIILVPFGALAWTVSKILRSIGFALQKNGYTHIRGSAPEMALENGKACVMTWNIRGDHGDMHHKRGLVHWQSRIDRIVETIKNENPDILLLQEVYDPALSEALASKLGDQYAHFFTHLGASTFGNSSGIMILSKCAIHQFSHTNFDKNMGSTTRSFEILTIKSAPDDENPSLRIMGTQLSEGDENKTLRMEQFSQLIHGLSKETLHLPTLVVGGLADRDSPDEGYNLSKYLYHSYLDSEPTRTDQLAVQWNPHMEGKDQAEDFISFCRKFPTDDRPLPVIEKNIRLINCYKLNVDANNSTKYALSDHDPVISHFDGLKEILQKN